MFELYQQLALLDSLLSEWDAIRIRMGPAGAARDSELARIAARLAAARSPDEFALLTDDLVDLVTDTPAEEFARELIARSSLGAGPGAEVRGIEPRVGEIVAATDLTDRAEQTGRELGRAMAARTDPVSVPVFFATNRKEIRGAPPEAAYGGDPGETSYGQAQVTIPVSHSTGVLETPHWWTLFPKKDPGQRFVILSEEETLKLPSFNSRLSQAFDSGHATDLLIFLHGYNVTFEAALRRAAQLAYDMHFRGAVVLFSWPSQGRVLRYGADEDRAAASAQPLAEFLQALVGGPWKKVHLLAHSMGNRVLFLGLVENRLPALPLNQIVLVAADIYVELFKQKFGKIADPTRPVTSYVSTRDNALLLSLAFHRTDRIGFLPDEPYLTEGLETIDATSVDTSLWGHSYFSNERSVLTDLGYLLREGFPAERRGLERVADKNYWKFPR